MKNGEFSLPRLVFKLIFYALVMLLALWGITFARCEYLTMRSLDDSLRQACVSQYGAPAQSTLKLLEYDEAGFAKLYLTDGASGSTVVMVVSGGEWKLVFSKTEWTRADKLDVVWPYVYYNKES